MSGEAAVLGAYGLRLGGVAGAEQALVPAPEAWPFLQIRVSTGESDRNTEHLDLRTAHIRLRTGGWVEVDRARCFAAYTVPVPLSADELVHPYLAPVAAVTAHWYGRESFHAGGIAIGDLAWGIVGDRHAGKSTTLAALADRGIDVVCDDVLVVDGLEPFAGPRTIDLRQDAAAALGLGEDIGLAGARERWRVRLPQLDRRLRLAGWIFATWSDETALEPLRPSETLARLLGNRGITAPPVYPAAFLALSALPAWELRRPRRWDALAGTLERLLERLAAG